jgi:protein-S-isoprenylcysteine O-methyltransferase Ste14
VATSLEERVVAALAAERGRDVPGLTPAPSPLQERRQRMSRRAAVALFVLALIAVVVGVDVLFFRNHVWERLIANIGIVMVFAAFALRYLRRT